MQAQQIMWSCFTLVCAGALFACAFAEPVSRSIGQLAPIQRNIRLSLRGGYEDDYGGGGGDGYGGGGYRG